MTSLVGDVIPFWLLEVPSGFEPLYEVLQTSA